MQSHSLKFKIGGILGGEVHEMWWVEYILNAIVVAIEREGRRKHRKRTAEEDEKGIRVSGNQGAGYQKIRVSGE